MAGYSQNDPRWAGDFLGTSNVWRMGTVNGDTAHAAGCLVTAGANVLKGLGHDITPGELNKLATARGLINNDGDVIRNDWLEVLFPDVLHFVERKSWPTTPADLHYLDIRNDLNTEIIIQIDDSPAAGDQTHYMRTVGWDGGSDVIVDDSWDAVRRGVNSYGARWNPDRTAADIIYTADKYVRVVPPAPQPAMVNMGQLTQLYHDLLNRDPDQSGIATYLGHFTYDYVQNAIKNSAEYAALHAPKSDPAPAPQPPAPTPEPAPQPVQPPIVTPPAPAPVPAPVPAPSPVVVGSAKPINTSWQVKVVWWLWKLIKTLAVSIKAGS